MKKVKLIIGNLFISGLILFNLSLMANKTDVLSNFNLAFLQQAFAFDLEEVTITCDGGGEGICYAEVPFRQYCPPNNVVWGNACTETGDPDDYCEKNVECYHPF